MTVRKLMEEKARAVQTVVSEISSFAEAVDYTIGLTRNQKQKTVASPGLGDEELRCLRSRCSEAGITLLESPLAANKTNIHTALTFAQWGIADTGTLVLPSDSEDIRIATMLAEIHVAVLPESRIVPDSVAITSNLNDILMEESPSYTAFITGASRTADIERVLAIGVHGPQELHLLIVTGA